MIRHLLLKQSLQFIVKVFEEVLESGLVRLIGAESSFGQSNKPEFVDKVIDGND